MRSCCDGEDARADEAGLESWVVWKQGRGREVEREVESSCAGSPSTMTNKA